MKHAAVIVVLCMAAPVLDSSSMAHTALARLPVPTADAATGTTAQGDTP